MKKDLFSIGHFAIHSYGLMVAIGFILCVLLGMYRGKKREKDPEAFLDIALIAIVVGFLGAKVLFVIVEFPRFLENPMSVLGSEGFVVYGGIVAGIASAMIYCKRKKLVFLEYFDLAAPSIALAQGFGRIGCFLAGCCYGRETDAWFGVTFPAGSMAPAGVKLIPTQLISSAGDFLLLLVLLLAAGGMFRLRTGDVGALYLLLYGIGRFGVECLRADDRGALGILSTSQAISIVIVIVAFVLFWWNRKRESGIRI